MKMIVCVADNNGILFNKRRVSRDKEVTADILSMTANTGLYAREYSKTIFPEDAKVIFDDNYMDIAGENDYIFTEEHTDEEIYEKIDEIVVYRWNRDYPADVFFEMPQGYTLSGTAEFAGNSHEKITRETYIK